MLGTYRLDCDREIETSVQINSNRMRLRARVTKGGIVRQVHRRDYAYHATNASNNVETFTKEFEKLTGLTLPRPFIQLPGVKQSWLATKSLPKEFARDHHIAAATYPKAREYPTYPLIPW